jgi:hypothetical protein
MNIDERLEKLTERHEALTQAVEIIAGMQRENERQIGDVTSRLGQVVDAIGRLARIAEIHEQRLDDLDSKQ